MIDKNVFHIINSFDNLYEFSLDLLEDQNINNICNTLMPAFKQENISVIDSLSNPFVFYRARKVELESLTYLGVEDYGYEEELEFWKTYCAIYFNNGKEIVNKTLENPYKITALSYLSVENHGVKTQFENNFYGYNKEKSGIAPKSKCKSFRFNKDFEPVLYLAEDVETCLVECGANYGELFSVGEFKNKSDVKVYDFTKNNSDFNNLWISCIASQINNSKTVYLKAQVLAECVKRLECDGLKYKSSKYPEGYCYAFFDAKKFDCYKSYFVKIDTIKITYTGN